ncbi:hypothetical protein LguiA_015930 [Lonicera macranthoides]
MNVNSDSEYDRLKEVKEFDETKIGVKGLSDSGITTIPRIFIHPSSLLQSYVQHSSSLSIPVINLSDRNSVDGRSKIVDQVREAAKEWGFFQVINHGIPISVVDDTIAAIKSFHDEPPEVKANYYIRDERRGVMFATNNDLLRSKAASWHDFIQVWMAPDAAEVDQIPAVLRKEAVAWDRHVVAVAETLAELLSEGLGLDSRKLKELRLLESRAWVGTCYPYCPQPELTVGLSHHTDPAVLTVLSQNQVEGLQVKHGEEWIDVKPIHGALTVNIGDLLQIISNGEYNSVQHRVLANSKKEARISVIEFFGAHAGEDESAEYGPLPELLSPEKPPLYRNFTINELTENFYKKGLDSKSLVQMLSLI